MAQDVSVKDLDAMRNLSSDLKGLSEELVEHFHAGQRAISDVGESWRDDQYFKFAEEFNVDVQSVERMAQKFRDYAAHIDKKIEPLEVYKNMR